MQIPTKFGKDDIFYNVFHLVEVSRVTQVTGLVNENIIGESQWCIL